MPQERVRCPKCSLLCPREYLSLKAQKHYDNVVAAERLERPAPPSLPSAHEPISACKAPSKDELLAERAKLDAILDGLPLDIAAMPHFVAKRQRWGEIEQLVDAPPEQTVDASAKAAALSRELNKLLADSDNEDKRINKYESAIKALQGQIRDYHASILTCTQGKQANEQRIAAITLELRDITSGALPSTEADTAEDEEMLPDPVVAQLEATQRLYQQQLQALSDKVSAHLSDEAKLDIQKTVSENERTNAEASADFKKQLLERRPPPKRTGVIKNLCKDKCKSAAEALAKAAAIKAAGEQQLKDATLTGS